MVTRFKPQTEQKVQVRRQVDVESRKRKHELETEERVQERRK